jgi:exodeoxyribonuclease VII large subunit
MGIGTFCFNATASVRTSSLRFLHNYPLANTYLTTTFKEKDAAKALGARWDAGQGKWYVPDGIELTPFSKWLPPGSSPIFASTSTELSSYQTGGTELSVPLKKGVSLSQLLAGVSQAVAQAYKAGVWTMVEVVELRANGGHVFMGVSERDAHGAVLAKTSAVIWQSTANTILPEFERATGAQLAPGIKLLVRARPVFKPLHGFTLEIDAIDSEYTLGDLEARKREIRERLQAEGVFASNKQLPPPWDFNAVLVVAPAGGAGLGDFQAEANRLEQFGICRFTYAYSRFQGEGAAKEVCDALQRALAAWAATTAHQPDAVVIIRGGGAVNDMAWLNDYDLARFICDLPIPVLTGIGHERDSTVLDEVANIRFDTPSKVIAGIEQVIAKRAAEAKANYQQVSNLAARAVQSVKAKTETLDMTVRGEALRHLAQGKQATAGLLSAIRVDAMQAVRSASEQSRETLQGVKTEAMLQLADAKRSVPSFWGQITLGAKHAIRIASAERDALIGDVLERAQRDAMRARQATEDALGSVSTSARLLVREGATRSEALMREIAGQGPEKTLNRGFAIVRNQVGVPLTRATHANDGAEIEIQFQDGRVAATTRKHL